MQNPEKKIIPEYSRFITTKVIPKSVMLADQLKVNPLILHLLFKLTASSVVHTLKHA